MGHLGRLGFRGVDAHSYQRPGYYLMNNEQSTLGTEKRRTIYHTIDQNLDFPFLEKFRKVKKIVWFFVQMLESTLSNISYI